jgi:ubiquinone/menaquinone biosynthesis C-methylase UbiE/uncharacterized protein YbaR (Trm112 family)
MRPETLEILCSPVERAPLELVTRATPSGAIREFLVNRERALEFPIRDGIPEFVQPGNITGLNRRFRMIYDICAPIYDLISRVGLCLFGIPEQQLRRDFVRSLDIRPGDRVLATSVGTGADLPFIDPAAAFYGLDLSAGMLGVCRRQLPKTGLYVELFLGEAEQLPFRDESFDVVYQMGGINFFNDQQSAINEMIRVAKIGARIVIMDETERVARAMKYVPGINAWFNHREQPIVAPRHLIPSHIEAVESSEWYDGLAWYLSFRKPA